MKHSNTYFSLLLSLILPNLIFAKGEKPNILIIFSDQQNTKTLGCYGADYMKTPNLDSLAKEGLRFTNYISNFPISSPYRGMLLTGKYPYNNGVFRNLLTVKEDVEMMGSIFKKQGYLVGYTGKWHLAGKKHSDIPENLRGGFSDYWDELVPQRLQSKKGEKGNSKIPKEYKAESGGGTYLDNFHADNAIEFIKKATAEKKPFLMVVSWNAPHPPYFAMKKDIENFSASCARIPSTFGTYAPNLPNGKPYTDNPADGSLDNRKTLVEKVLRPYYASCEALDRDFGRIMKILDELKISDNTIVIYTSDHGDQIGSHHLIGKVKPYEESINVPFIIRYPRGIKKGLVTDALMSPIDVIPTTLSLADIKYDSKAFDGMSLKDVMQSKKDAKEQDAILILSNSWRGVRTKTHTYVEASSSPWMLFDNIKDPEQCVNLVNDQSHSKLLESLKAKLYELLKKSSDPLANPTKETLNEASKRGKKLQ